MRDDEDDDGLVIGAKKIADEIGGDATRNFVYSLRRKNTGFPFIVVNNILCARKSKIRKWMEEKEQQNPH